MLIGYGDTLWPVRNRTDMELHTKVQWEENFGYSLKRDAKGVLMHSSVYASYYDACKYMYYPIEETTYRGKRKTKGIEEFYELYDAQQKGDKEYIQWRYSKLTREYRKDECCKKYPEELYDVDPVRVLCVSIYDTLAGWFLLNRKTGLETFDFRKRSWFTVDSVELLFPDGKKRDVIEIIQDKGDNSYGYQNLYIDFFQLEQFSVESLLVLLKSIRTVKNICQLLSPEDGSMP